MQRRIFWYEFLLLWGTAVVGTTLGLLVTEFPGKFFAPQLYVPLRTESSSAVLIALTAQIGIQLAVVTGVGLWAAHRVGLGAPILEACFQNEPAVQLLRGLVLPVMSIALLFAVVSNLPDLSVFHPNRTERTAELTAFLQSPDGLKLQAQLDTLEPPPRPLSIFSQTLFYIESAVNNGIYDQLFMVSVFALLLSQINSTRSSGSDTKGWWSAIIIATAFGAIGIAVRHLAPSQIDRIWLAVFPNHRDPFLLLYGRDLLRTIPQSLALGWLYVRYGIEAVIMATLLGSILGYLFFILVFVKFA